MSAAAVFAHVLRIIGVERLVLSRRLVRRYFHGYKSSSERMLHKLANLVLSRRAKICRESVWGVPIGLSYGVELLYDVRASRQSDVAARTWDENCVHDVTNRVVKLLHSVMPRVPLFVIDFGLWELHSETEANEVFKQILVTIDTVREHLTDLNLVLVAVPYELRARIDSMLQGHAVAMYGGYELYKDLDPKRSAVLDPYADEVLDEEAIRRIEVFILGGIVDNLYPRPYATKTMIELHGLEDFPRYSLKLWGSTVGVPNRVNKLIEIVMQVRYGISLEKAIVANMSVGDKVARVLHEVHRRFGKERRLKLSDLLSIMRELELDERLLGRVLSSLRDFKIA